jgi:hypothetical protein
MINLRLNFHESLEVQCYKKMNLDSRFYILFIHNRRKKPKKDIRISISPLLLISYHVHDEGGCSVRPGQRPLLFLVLLGLLVQGHDEPQAPLFRSHPAPDCSSKDIYVCMH